MTNPSTGSGQVGSTTIYFIGAHYEVTGSEITKYYTSAPLSAGFAGTQRIAMRQGTTLYYLLSDHLGSTSIVTDAAGQVISQTKYKAWGEVRYSSGASPTDFTFTGQKSYVSSFGLLFYQSRFYDPSLSRFVSADTIVPSGAQGLDRYAYTNNNPVNYTDPSGHCSVWGDNWCYEENGQNEGAGSMNDGSDYGLIFSSNSNYEGLEDDTQAFIDAVRLEAERMFDVYCNPRSEVIAATTHLRNFIQQLMELRL